MSICRQEIVLKLYQEQFLVWAAFICGAGGRNIEYFPTNDPRGCCKTIFHNNQIKTSFLDHVLPFFILFNPISQI